MRTNTLLYIGGCSGSFPVPSENRPHWDPDTTPWGIRPESFNRHAYGGRTTSFMIRSENAFFLIDHGSGIDLSAQLVSEMLKREQRKEAKIVVLQTHFHMDHINGTPQNWLLFRPGTLLHYYSPDLSPFRPSTEHSVGFSGMEHVLRAYFNPSGTYFPVPLDRLPSQQEFTKFEVGKTLNLGDGQAYTIPSKHPGGCCAYRIELPKCKPIVILTDYEPDLEPDRAMVDFIDGAGLLLVDMQYTDDEYEGTKPIGGMQMPRVGWGHGTPRRVFPTVLACKHPPAVRIVHHDPRKSDADLDLFYEHSVDVLEELSGSKKLPFNYQFARGADAYWL